MCQAEWLRGGRQGHNLFPFEVENEITEKIKEAGKSGLGVTRGQLALKISRLTSKMNIKTPFRNGIPGKDWVASFKKRHPYLSQKTSTPLSEDGESQGCQ
jgi:hypothetical protein